MACVRSYQMPRTTRCIDREFRLSEVSPIHGPESGFYNLRMKRVVAGATLCSRAFTCHKDQQTSKTKMSRREIGARAVCLDLVVASLTLDRCNSRSISICCSKYLSQMFAMMWTSLFGRFDRKCDFYYGLKFLLGLVWNSIGFLDRVVPNFPYKCFYYEVPDNSISTVQEIL